MFWNYGIERETHQSWVLTWGFDCQREGIKIIWRWGYVAGWNSLVGSRSSYGCKLWVAIKHITSLDGCAWQLTGRKNNNTEQPLPPTWKISHCKYDLERCWLAYWKQWIVSPCRLNYHHSEVGALVSQFNGFGTKILSHLTARKISNKTCRHVVDKSAW